jgi:transitional endoplasmic reticulum ATPase
MQEAFVAALLAIAREPRVRRTSIESLMEDLGDGWVGVAGGGADLDRLVLWVEIKKQVAILREGMEKKADLKD